MGRGFPKRSLCVCCVVEEGWSRSRLENQIAANLFGSQGAAITNFSSTLPDTQSQLAKEILKDPYHFGFLSMNEKYDENDLEDALVSKVTQFLLELGKGFSYVGRQMELQMPGGQTFFPDLLFYHIPQHRYEVVELKVVKFIPEFAGKLNFYVTAVDELLRARGTPPLDSLIVACFQHAIDVLPPPSPHTALHFVTLMWGY